mmetsp:Transcript_89799/g.257284  ORF Transcript_89799/g.257284 Transcript_89799/m.257284 type:complete len:207 (-) Transcript_89799:500-1120(-)
MSLEPAPDAASASERSEISVAEPHRCLAHASRAEGGQGSTWSAAARLHSSSKRFAVFVHFDSASKSKSQAFGNRSISSGDRKNASRSKFEISIRSRKMPSSPASRRFSTLCRRVSLSISSPRAAGKDSKMVSAKAPRPQPYSKTKAPRPAEHAEGKASATICASASFCRPCLSACPISVADSGSDNSIKALALSIPSPSTRATAFA